MMRDPFPSCVLAIAPSLRTVQDVISAVEFDIDGLHLATGDRGGRVVLFERVNPNAVSWVSQQGCGVRLQRYCLKPSSCMHPCMHATAAGGHGPAAGTAPAAGGGV